MKATVSWIAVVAGLMMAGGCGSDYQNYNQTFLGSGMCNAQNAPDWVKGPVGAEDNENLYFVGRGIAHNVLDERAGYNAARDHVLEQLARHVATWVSARAGEGDRRTFRMESGWPFLGRRARNRHFPGERSKGYLASHVRLCTEALAGDLEEVETYWEQWEVREHPERPMHRALRMKRYKCWVLMAVPKAKVESRVQATLEALRVASAGPNKLYGVVASHGASPAAGRLNAAGAAQLFKIAKGAAPYAADRRSRKAAWSRTLAASPRRTELADAEADLDRVRVP